jgi:hypothetical protein
MVRPNRIILAVAASAALAIGLGPVAASAQHDGQGHEDQAHDDGHHTTRGGTVVETEYYRFEVIFEEGGLRVVPRGWSLKPGSVDRLKARAYFLMPGAKAYTDPYPLQPVATTPGQPAKALGTDLDLSGVPAEGTRVTFQVWGLPDPAEPKAEFTVPFCIGESAVIRTVKATEADKLGVAAQATCPITGDDLNAMGGPIKVVRGDESLFICCQGCLAKVEAEPDRYFGSVISAAKATESDAEAVAAQGTCPISSQDLNAMGGPIKISRAGKSVFICCPACIDAVKADAAKYLGAAPSAGRGEHDHGG